MHSCLCLFSLLRSDENMFESGSIVFSRVLSETQALGDFSKALTAVVESVFSHDWTVLAASLAGPCTFAILSRFFRVKFCRFRHFAICVLKLFVMKWRASSFET